MLNGRTAGLVDELVEAGIIDDLQDEGFLMLHSTREEAEASRASLLAVSRRGPLSGARSDRWDGRRCSSSSRGSATQRSSGSSIGATGGWIRRGWWIALPTR